MTMHLLLFALGLLLLTVGGEALIRGSLAMAQRLQISPLLSGLIIVGFGTSAPELVVSVNAALEGQPDIAVGNVVGSNIGNILLILGLCAVVTPLTIQPLALRRDATVMLLTSVIFVVLAHDQRLGIVDAGLLATGLVAYLIWAYCSESAQTTPAATLHQAEYEALTQVPKSLTMTLAAVVIGLSLLIAGAHVFLSGATGIAEYFGVPSSVIGLTLVAVGTSLPELSISVIAALRKQSDVAVGNVLGSNIFNLLGILSVSALLQPLPIHARVMAFDQWVMLATSVLLLLFLYSGRRLSRLEGGVLLLGYLLYVALSFAKFAS